MCVDIQENLLDEQTYAFLESLALSGQLCAVLGGPPCKTFSLSRYMQPELPRPLRGRTASTQWGFEHLTPSEREAIMTDGVLMFRMVWLFLIAEAVAEELNHPKPFFGMEHPKDPETWTSPAELGLEPPPDGFASCWALDAIKDLAEQHDLCYWHLDQGPLGHEKRKPTTILSSIPPPPDVQVSRPGHGVRELGASAAGHWPSSAWAAWAPGLKANLKREILSTVDAFFREVQRFARAREFPHMDFRRDCAACLAGAARGARHNRRSVHDAWVLHVDLMGPFAEGADEHGKVRYALTGILTVPDLSRVADAVKESDDIAAGPETALCPPCPDHEVPGLPAGVQDQVPLSSLGPPPAVPLRPIAEDDLEEYAPSDDEPAEDIMTVRPEEAEVPETEAEASAAASRQPLWHFSSRNVRS